MNAQMVVDRIIENGQGLLSMYSVRDRCNEVHSESNEHLYDSDEGGIAKEYLHNIHAFYAKDKYVVAAVGNKELVLPHSKAASVSVLMKDEHIQEDFIEVKKGTIVRISAITEVDSTVAPCVVYCVDSNGDTAEFNVSRRNVANIKKVLEQEEI